MHAGRKGSCVALYLNFSAVATPTAGGWADKIVAPSAIPFEQGYPVPHALSIEEIEGLVIAFKESARRAVIAGYDVINIHAAHVCASFVSFLSVIDLVIFRAICYLSS